MGNNDVTTMPSYVCQVDMAQRFVNRFIEKESNIRKHIVDCGEDAPYPTMAATNNDAVFGGVPLVCFESHRIGH